MRSDVLPGGSVEHADFTEASRFGLHRSLQIHCEWCWRIYGYKVEEFASGEELVARGHIGNGDCVILDVDLPGAGGIETLARLRAMGSAVPAVLVSGRATDKMRAEARQLEALAFLEKPVDIDSLLDKVDSIGK